MNAIAKLSARWEVVTSEDYECTERLAVPGGWLYRTARPTAGVALCFVPAAPEPIAVAEGVDNDHTAGGTAEPLLSASGALPVNCARCKLKPAGCREATDLCPTCGAEVMDIQAKAYGEGRGAFYAGRTRAENPYPSNNARQWEEGWVDGDEATRAQQWEEGWVDAEADGGGNLPVATATERLYDVPEEGE